MSELEKGKCPNCSGNVVKIFQRSLTHYWYYNYNREMKAWVVVVDGSDIDVECDTKHYHCSECDSRFGNDEVFDKMIAAIKKQS